MSDMLQLVVTLIIPNLTGMTQRMSEPLERTGPKVSLILAC
jgi:hypothetical protein